jgi:hypothetical protein
LNEFVAKKMTLEFTKGDYNDFCKNKKAIGLSRLKSRVTVRQIFVGKPSS